MTTASDRKTWDLCPDAEEAVIGTLMVEAQACKVAQLYLRPTDLYSEANRRVYEAVEALLDSQAGGVDIVTVAERMRADGTLEAAGGTDHLRECIAKAATAAHMEWYCRIVQQASLRRQFHVQLGATTEFETPENVAKLADLVLRLEGSSGGHIFDFRVDIKDAVEALLRNKTPGLQTGFFQLDSLFSGLAPDDGDLLVIGGRASEGKTAMMTRMCCNMAMGAGGGDSEECLYLTTEMSEHQMVYRVLPMATGIPAYKYRSKTLTPEEIGLTCDVAAEKLMQLPIQVLGKSELSIQDIRSTCARARPRVVFIDYLDRCKFPRAENRAYAIGEFLRLLRNFLKDTHILGVLGAQLDRGMDKTPNTPPSLADLRGSGAIEHEATHVVLIWRPPAKKIEVFPSPGCIPLEAIVGKNRFGPRFVTADFELNEELVKFTERGSTPAAGG